MADYIPTFFGSDKLLRSVAVVVVPLDVVTNRRVPVLLEVEIKEKTANPRDDEPLVSKPIAARSGVYCFTDLQLEAGTYVVEVRPLEKDRGRYFDALEDLNFTPVPIPNQPLKRNRVEVRLLPRPAYPFDAETTLVRGQLIKDSDGSPIENAEISLTIDTVDKGFWQRTDERGEFVIFFPRTAPGVDPTAGVKEFKFKLEFKIENHAPHPTAEETVKEGTTKSMKEIRYAGT
jgi:hypothetical protein